MPWLKRTIQNAVALGMRVPGLRQTAGGAARWGVIPHAVWRRIPVTGIVHVTIDSKTEIVYRSGLMDHLGRALFFGNATAWEPEILRVLPTLARLSPGVLDVGAHTGLFTLIALAANPKARAVAVEPVMANAQLLQANLDANHMATRCILCVAAVADQPGVVSFDRGPVEIPMTSSIRTAEPDADVYRVPAVNLDTIARWLPTVDLIKVDVEGFEHLVLAGGRELFAASRPTLIVECLPGSRIGEFDSFLDQLGYQRFHLLPSHAEPIDRVHPTADGPSHNYLLAARPEILAVLRKDFAKAG